MNVSTSMMKKATDTLDLYSEIIAEEIDILSIGCTFCANCSGIVGG